MDIQKEIFDPDGKVEEWCRRFPGDNEYACEWCGLYNASKPHCNQCEQTN